MTEDDPRQIAEEQAYVRWHDIPVSALLRDIADNFDRIYVRAQLDGRWRSASLASLEERALAGDDGLMWRVAEIVGDWVWERFRPTRVRRQAPDAAETQ